MSRSSTSRGRGPPGRPRVEGWSRGQRGRLTPAAGRPWPAAGERRPRLVRASHPPAPGLRGTGAGELRGESSRASGRQRRRSYSDAGQRRGVPVRADAFRGFSDRESLPQRHLSQRPAPGNPGAGFWPRRARGRRRSSFSRRGLPIVPIGSTLNISLPVITDGTFSGSGPDRTSSRCSEGMRVFPLGHA